MEKQKEVKIIGLSIKEQFGILKATELKFDSKLKLTAIKGAVGAGKTTLNKALRLTTQGSNTLQDKTLYGDNVDIETQLSDGGKKVFIGCKSDKDGSLQYSVYMIDENGKKINDPVIDGAKVTPAAYLKNLQTALTWRIDEFTSENPTTIRNILLELYTKELEDRGVVFEKKNTKYVGGIIDQIEKAKEKRSFADMKRKEVGGIADDLSKKGVDFSSRVQLRDLTADNQKLSELRAKRTLKTTNLKESRDADLNKIKAKGVDFNYKLKDANSKIKEQNIKENDKKTKFDISAVAYKDSIEKAKNYLIPFLKEEQQFNFEDRWNDFTSENLNKPKEPILALRPELTFDEDARCTSKAEDFYGEIFELLNKYKETKTEYLDLFNKPIEEVDTKDIDLEIAELEKQIVIYKNNNTDALAVNSLIDWKEADAAVKDLNKDYYKKLTGIDTGVKGLHITPEYIQDGKELVAKGNDIYLMYDGSYDPEYFHNTNGELRKLSSYSDTQKPMICLLIQKYLLSKKTKVLPYLWIDQIPIDKKTKELLDKMSVELGLHLFVNWTGDFDVAGLKDGEILVENGEVFNNLLLKETEF